MFDQIPDAVGNEQPVEAKKALKPLPSDSAILEQWLLDRDVMNRAFIEETRPRS